MPLADLALGFAALGMIFSYLLKFAGFINGPMAYVAGSGWRAYLKSVLAFIASQFAPPQATIIVPLFWLLAVYLLLRFFATGRLEKKTFFALLVLLLISDLLDRKSVV